MFRDARVLTAERTKNAFSQEATRYSNTRENWFDGSVESIDERLAFIKKLTHRVESALRDQALDHDYLRARRMLARDKKSIEALREDRLDGGLSRQASVDQLAAAVTGTSIDTLHKQGSLTGADHRWLILEAAKFLATNRDVRHDLAELTTRARRYASDAMSTRTASKCDLMTGLFVTKVQQGYRPKRKSRVAAAAPCDFDDSMMYLA